MQVTEEISTTADEERRSGEDRNFCEKAKSTSESRTQVEAAIRRVERKL